jgi:hypothetical protein
MQGIIITIGRIIKGNAQDIIGINNRKGTETAAVMKLTTAVIPALFSDFSRGFAASRLLSLSCSHNNVIFNCPLISVGGIVKYELVIR